jgi:hypothetical protein
MFLWLCMNVPLVIAVLLMICFFISLWNAVSAERRMETASARV